MLIDVQTAQQKIWDNVKACSSCLVPLGDALCKTLAHDVHAIRPYPPFDRATKDGIAMKACNAQNGAVYESELYAKAGMAQVALQDPSHCIEIATGAPLPNGADTVIPYEELEKTNEGFKLLKDAVEQGINLHKNGTDIQEDDLLLSKGSVIAPPELAILASNGIAEVCVFDKPKIAIITTGDELLPLGSDAQSHQLYRSNDLMLLSVFKARHYDVNIIAHASDDLIKTRKIIEDAIEQSDVVIVTGGVSKGEYDFVPKALDDLEIKEIFHGIAQRPGKPMWFGTSKAGVPVFGLPGNPVSALTCAIRYVLPTIRFMSGFSKDKNTPVYVTLNEAIDFKPALTYFASVRIDEHHRAYPVRNNGSGDFISLAQSSGFIELPANECCFYAGEEYSFYPWRLP